MSSNISFLTSTLTPISILWEVYSISYLSANSWTHLAPLLPGATIIFFVFILNSSFLFLHLISCLSLLFEIISITSVLSFISQPVGADNLPLNL